MAGKSGNLPHPSPGIIPRTATQAKQNCPQNKSAPAGKPQGLDVSELCLEGSPVVRLRNRCPECLDFLDQERGRLLAL